MMRHRTMRQILADLPTVCAAYEPASGKPIMLHQEPGYTPLPDGFDVERFNDRHGVTEAQQEAMLIGTMFGFHVPGADPLNHDDASEAEE